MKLRIGEDGKCRPLSVDEVRGSAPECAPEVGIPVLAVRMERVTAKTGCLRALHRVGRGSYLGHFAQELPEVFRNWLHALQARTGSEGAIGYLPFPVHPLQLGEIKGRFADAITAREILILPDVTIPADPTMSLRTLRPRSGTHTPLIKTSLNVLMTSVVRTLAPARAFNAPVLSDLVLQLVALTGDTSDVLRTVPEPAAIYWGRDPHPDSASYRAGYQLSAVLKGDPAKLVGEEETAVPLNALFAVSPLSGERLILDVMRHASIENGTDALAYYSDYASLVLRGDLGMLARYGVGLESHQQNLELVFGPDGRLRAGIYGDINGGIEIFEPLLRANGFDIRGLVHPVRRGLHNTLDVPLRQTIHTTFLSHLVPLAFIVANGFGVSEADLFARLRDLTRGLLQRIELRHGPVIAETGGMKAHMFFRQTQAALRRGLLEDPWEVKCLFRMRALQTQSAIHRSVTNPLAAA